MIEILDKLINVEGYKVIETEDGITDMPRGDALNIAQGFGNQDIKIVRKYIGSETYNIFVKKQ